MKPIFSTLALCSALLACSVSAQPTLSEIVRDDWATIDGHWYDGKAEMATYAGERRLYGKSRPHTHNLITVKEDFTKEYWVKADWPYGDKPLLPVVKQNQVAVVPTENYPYNFMNSVFFDLSDIGHAVKLTATSTEWCGITLREFHLYRDPVEYIYSSYWDGEGTGETKLQDHTAETYFEEELPVLVRAIDHADGLTASFALQPNMTISRAPIPKPSVARVTVSAPDSDLSVPISKVAKEEYWKVDVVAQDGRELTFSVGRDYPNTLYHYDMGDGRVYKLEELERRAYWER